MYIMWALQYIHDNLSKWHIDCWVLHTKWYPSVIIDEKNPSYTRTWEQIKWRSMSKQNREVNIYIMLALQCMHDNLFIMHGFCWALHAKWYPSVRIDEEHPSKTRPRKEGIWRSRSKQNRRCTSMSCWHCNACMIIC